MRPVPRHGSRNCAAIHGLRTLAPSRRRGPMRSARRRRSRCVTAGGLDAGRRPIRGAEATRREVRRFRELLRKEPGNRAQRPHGDLREEGRGGHARKRVHLQHVLVLPFCHEKIDSTRSRARKRTSRAFGQIHDAAKARRRQARGTHVLGHPRGVLGPIVVEPVLGHDLDGAEHAAGPGCRHGSRWPRT